MANRKGVAPGDADQDASVAKMLAELQTRDAARQYELDRLSGLVQQLTQVSSIECILTNGFEELSAKLGPLEDLTPKRERLDEKPAARLRSLIKALARPNWSGATSLPVPNNPVDPIGATDIQSSEGSLRS